ncbi:MAG: phosphopentomutase [Fusobacteriaceae bacterium]|nr:phosphopentomutase [Fusobacteriaceae bacterium]MBN2839324.1 phosphopentomutase [Fusobacteriaceae bacterium]
MDKMERVTLIVLDSVGVGELPDAHEFGDVGSNTLGHIAEKSNGITLPNMGELGLGNLTEVKGVLKNDNPKGAYGKAIEASKGKDTTTGHWEISGVILEKPFPSYPNGFPQIILDKIEEKTGRKIICNKPYSGTEVIKDFGEEQMETGAWIVYTSADPVLQIAANEEIIPLQELYDVCKYALEICEELSPIARVIARPFVGKDKESFKRTSNRHDYSILPPKETVLDRLKAFNLDVIGIGKTSDIFSGKGITESRGTNKDNKDGILKTISALKEDTKGLIFTNLVDFDMLYGHRRDIEGYKNALEEFDNYLPEIIENMKEKEVLIITADHGCDPAFKGTDHTREYIPILVYGKGIKPVNLGIRSTFADIAATVEELLTGTVNGNSFAKDLF